MHPSPISPYHSPHRGHGKAEHSAQQHKPPVQGERGVTGLREELRLGARVKARGKDGCTGRVRDRIGVRVRGRARHGVTGVS